MEIEIKKTETPAVTTSSGGERQVSSGEITAAALRILEKYREGFLELAK